MLLKIEDITGHYGKAVAISNISLEIKEGEIVSLLGNNGAGKTTTLNIISGLKTLTSGKVWYGGKRIDGIAPDKIVGMGIIQVPEGRMIFPELTVLENLMVGAYLIKDRNEVKKTLSEIFINFPILKERLKLSGESLSGGEQQMLAISRALMAKPKLLLIDEASLGLSPIVVEELSKIIADINRRGVTILLVEQNAMMALKISHRGYVVEKGKISLHGSAKELRDNDLIKSVYLGL